MHNLNKLASAVRQIRDRRKESQIVFGQRLGVGHPAISRYESGTGIPKRTVLVKLLQLAVSEEEKTPILEAMGVDEALRAGWGARDLEISIELHDRAHLGGRLKPEPLWKRGALAEFAENAGLIVRQIGDVDPSIVSLLRYWIEFHDEPRALEDFRDAVGYLSVQLAQYKAERVAAKLGARKPKKGKD
jgi:transcriptional regulator with XRE-family HTH domain